MGSPYVWDESYKAAFIESDGQKLRKCLYAAKVAIDNRLHELQLADGGTQEERQAISDALSSLNLIRKESENPGQRFEQQSALLGVCHECGL